MGLPGNRVLFCARFMVQNDCRLWAREIARTWRPDLIVFLAKSGFLFAEPMAQELGCPMADVVVSRPDNGAKDAIRARIPWVPRWLQGAVLASRVNTLRYEADGRRFARLGVRFAAVDKDACGRVLVVDDSVDTGWSMCEALDLVRSELPGAEVRVAAYCMLTESESRVQCDYHRFRDTVVVTATSRYSPEHEDFVATYEAWSAAGEGAGETAAGPRPTSAAPNAEPGSQPEPQPASEPQPDASASEPRPDASEAPSAEPEPQPRAAQADSQPCATIIVPAYNARARIERCLDSLLAQTRGDFEAIVVDDGSTDGTGELVERVTSADPRFCLLRQDNAGVSVARNNAIRRARGTYLLFVDSDDFVEPTFVERMVGTAESAGADAVVCEYRRLSEKDGRVKVVRLEEHEGMSFPEAVARDETRYGGFSWNKLLRRDSLTAPFREDLRYYENLVFLLSNTSERTRYAVVHEPLYTYCIHPDSVMHSMEYDPALRDILTGVEVARGLLPESMDAYYKCLYINRYARVGLLARRAHRSQDVEKELRRAKGYLREVLSAKDVPASLRVRALLICHAPFVYATYARMAHR